MQHNYFLACASHTGRLRAHNEDNFLFFGNYMPEEHGSLEQMLFGHNDGSGILVGLFDGMGGESAGEVASFAAAKALCERNVQPPFNRKQMKELLLHLNEVVCQRKHEGRYRTMGTTATLFAMQDNMGWIANIGDSPAFLLRNGRMDRLSVEHTNARWLQQQGIDRRPGLTQYLGMDEDGIMPEPAIREVELRRGDSILLCSDGLTDMVETDDIRRTLREEGELTQITGNLISQALRKGGKDNITVILLRCEE